MPESVDSRGLLQFPWEVQEVLPEQSAAKQAAQLAAKKAAAEAAARAARIAAMAAITKRAKAAIAYAAKHNPLPIQQAALKPRIAAKDLVSSSPNLPARKVSALAENVQDVNKTWDIIKATVVKPGVSVIQTVAEEAVSDFANSQVPGLGEALSLLGPKRNRGNDAAKESGDRGRKKASPPAYNYEPPREVHPGGSSDNTTTITGHGWQPTDRFGLILPQFQVPKGTFVKFHIEDGKRLGDARGFEIESGAKTNGVETIAPGTYMNELVIVPPEGLKIRANSVRVAEPTKLSDMLEENMGCVHVAVCREYIPEVYAPNSWKLPRR